MELAECDSDLDQEKNKIRKTLRTCWVASSFIASQLFGTATLGYSILNRHFDLSKVDNSRNETERVMYSGLSKRCSSPQFLLDSAIMYYILAELPMLSESLQETVVISADKLIRSFQIFEAMKGKPDTKTLEVKIAIKKGTFSSAPLIQNHKIPVIITSVINNLKKKECLRQFLATNPVGQAHHCHYVKKLMNHFQMN